MDTNPLVSIIIPSYNREDLIGQTLSSIQVQSFKSWECIVVDDGSIDSTLNQAQKFRDKDSRFKLFTRPEQVPKGANSCRNFGFKQARGQFVIWFDSDDVMLPTDLETRMANSQDKDVVITLATITDSHLNAIRDFRVEDTMDLYHQYAYTKTEMITGSAMFRHSFLNGKSLFNPKIVRGQEADFFLRIYRGVKPDRFVVLNKIGFLYRQHAATKTAESKTYKPEFKNSQLTIYSDNLEYAVSKKDQQLAKYMYKQLLPLIFEAAINRDIKNMNFGIEKLKKALETNNKKLVAKAANVARLYFILKRPSYRLSKKLLNASISL